MTANGNCNSAELPSQLALRSNVRTSLLIMADMPLHFFHRRATSIRSELIE